MMAGLNRDPKTALHVYGVVMDGFWVVLSAFLLILAVVRLVEGQFRDAAFASIFAVVTLAVAALFHSRHRRQLACTPRWARNLPAEVLDDPQRRFDAFRRTWQARAWSWAMLLSGIGGGIWAVAVGE